MRDAVLVLGFGHILRIYVTSFATISRKQYPQPFKELNCDKSNLAVFNSLLNLLLCFEPNGKQQYTSFNELRKSCWFQVPLQLVRPLDANLLNGFKLGLEGEHQYVNAGLAIALSSTWLQRTGHLEVPYPEHTVSSMSDQFFFSFLILMLIDLYNYSDGIDLSARAVHKRTNCYSQFTRTGSNCPR